MNDTIRILSVGNSFSVGATKYLHRIAANYGVGIDTCNLFIGGCPLERHYQNAVDDAPAYRLYRNGEWGEEDVRMSETLAAEDWDYITFQQASYYSFRRETYEPYLSNLAAYVRKICPRAKFLIHQTQECCNARCRLSFGLSGRDEMYAQLTANYAEAAKTIGAVGILPTGFAVHLALGKYNVFENLLFVDYTSHLGPRYGCYLAGLAWFGALTGRDVRSDAFSVDGADPRYTALMRLAAAEAAEAYRIE